VVEPSADRVILHVDMDAFFASVEVLDDPSLAGLPVIVGGSGPRGVVAACTYEARRYGVRSAMPSSTARRLCPRAVFVNGRFHRYVEESTKLHAIFEEVTPLVEGISLDEAFLDVTGSVRRLGDGPTIGAAIRERVADRLHLACSVGIGRSKLMAKLASKAAKPVADRSGIRPGPGVVEVPAADELAFLHPLPIRALWGIGPATARRLDGIGVRTVGDLAALPSATLVRRLGTAQGTHLAELARGVDTRPVEPVREAKSIGHEETFPADLWDSEVLHRHLARMVDASATHLRAADLSARTITVKVRFGDFTMLTRSHSLAVPVDSAPSIGAVASALLDSVELNSGVRLLGVSLSGFADAGAGTQLTLDFAEPAPDGPEAPDDDPLARAHEEAARLQDSWGGVTEAVDAIRRRFGTSSVGTASLVGAAGLRVRDRGEAQWGPTAPEPSEDPTSAAPEGPAGHPSGEER
jgi:DNA polymerase IV